mgnify:CR=1 FL=1
MAKLKIRQLKRNGLIYLTVDQAAPKLGLAETYLRQLCREDKAVCFRGSRQWFVQVEATAYCVQMQMSAAQALATVVREQRIDTKVELELQQPEGYELL